MQLITDIEGGNIAHADHCSRNHIRLRMRRDEPSMYTYPDHQAYWFYFRLEGVRGRTIRVDMNNCDWMPSHWIHYRPVYSYAADPNELEGVTWHPVRRTKWRWKKFTFIHPFEEDAAWVALRYPYSRQRELRYLERARLDRRVSVLNIGQTAMGADVFMAVIGEPDAKQHQKTGALVLAREHGVEQDGSWVAEGIIDFLLSESETARALLRKTVFMVILNMSPDAAAEGRAVDPTTGSHPGLDLAQDRITGPEAAAVYERVLRFTEEGGSLEAAISLHSPHGTEPNLYPIFRPFGDTGRLEKSRHLHQAIRRKTEAMGYSHWREEVSFCSGYSVGRFARDFDSAAVIYEVNHQARRNFLTPEGLNQLGKAIAEGMAHYFTQGTVT